MEGWQERALTPMSAVEWGDYLLAIEFVLPAFIEGVLKAYQLSETGVTAPKGEIITDERGGPIRLGAGEGVAQAAGFYPERPARSLRAFPSNPTIPQISAAKPPNKPKISSLDAQFPFFVYSIRLKASSYQSADSWLTAVPTGR